MQQDKKRLRSMIIWNTIGFLCFIGVIISSIIMISIIVDQATQYDPYYDYPTYPSYPSTNETALEAAIGFMVAIAILGIVGGLTHLILSIKILATHWNTEWCKKNKILWGLLALLLLGFIAIYVFACSGKKHLNDRPEYMPNQGYYQNNPFNNPYNPQNNPYGQNPYNNPYGQQNYNNGYQQPNINNQYPQPNGYNQPQNNNPYNQPYPYPPYNNGNNGQNH